MLDVISICGERDTPVSVTLVSVWCVMDERLGIENCAFPSLRNLA